MSTSPDQLHVLRLIAAGLSPWQGAERPPYRFRRENLLLQMQALDLITWTTEPLVFSILPKGEAILLKAAQS